MRILKNEGTSESSWRMEFKDKFDLMQNNFEICAYEGSLKSAWNKCVMKKALHGHQHVLVPKKNYL